MVIYSLLVVLFLYCLKFCLNFYFNLLFVLPYIFCFVDVQFRSINVNVLNIFIAKPQPAVWPTPVFYNIPMKTNRIKAMGISETTLAPSEANREFSLGM